jgi:hypothetical protein
MGTTAYEILRRRKLEIIRLVEQSDLPQRRSLANLGIPRQTFYRWYDRFRTGGPEALADRPSRPDRVWNRIPDAVQGRIIDLALEVPELSPRELAVRFTDQESYFVSEASVYRLLKSRDLIPSPTFIQVKVTEEFHTKTGPVPVLCRSFDHILCSKGDEPWAQAGRMNFAKKRCG